MIIHVFELCQSASDHLLRIHQLASSVTVQNLGCLCLAAACDQCCRVGRAGRYSVLTCVFHEQNVASQTCHFHQTTAFQQGS